MKTLRTDNVQYDQEFNVNQMRTYLEGKKYLSKTGRGQHQTSVLVNIVFN